MTARITREASPLFMKNEWIKWSEWTPPAHQPISKLINSPSTINLLIEEESDGRLLMALALAPLHFIFNEMSLRSLFFFLHQQLFLFSLINNGGASQCWLKRWKDKFISLLLWVMSRRLLCRSQTSLQSIRLICVALSLPLLFNWRKKK